MRALTAGTWLVLAQSAPALAHGDAPHAAALGWTLDPWMLVPLAVAGMLYGAGAVVLWRRRGAGRSRQSWRAACYAGGWLALAGALASPLHALGEQLFTAHMIEHEVVMAAAAPLLVLARPGGTLLWALPRSLRHSIGRALRGPIARAAWRWLTRPLTATALHGVAIWAWHAPALFDAALADVSLHRLQHLSFLITALLFWWSLVRRAGHGAGVWHLFATMIHTSVLGALIALAPRVLYGAQTLQAPAWGLTPLEDQQLAGIVMWVPAGTVYAGAALAFAALWISRSSRGWRAAGATDGGEGLTRYASRQSAPVAAPRHG